MKLEKENFEEVAIDLSLEDGKIQAHFFNTFFKALKANCGDEYRTQFQLSYMADYFSDITKQRVAFLAEDENSR